MPYGPRPTNIRFNYAAAADAVAELERLHGRLTTGAAPEHDASVDALAQWEGLAADNFRIRRGEVNSERAILAGRILTLKGQISGAIDDAWWAQQDVNRRQEDWDAEWLAELNADEVVL